MKIKNSKPTDLVTQNDLEEWGEVLVDRIDKLDGRMEGLESNIQFLVREEVVKAKDEILNRIDGFVKSISDLEDENAAGNSHFKRVDTTLANHETRIQKLETA